MGKSHVLDEDGIDTSLLQLLNELAGGIEFTIVEDGIDGGVDLHSEGMGIVAELADIADAIAHCCTGSETGSAYIDRIGTVVDSRDATRQILCRGQ